LLRQQPPNRLSRMNTTTKATRVIRDEIRAAGLRATLGRVATLKLLREADSPVTHSFVADGLGDLGIDKATVFRNLNDMTDAGLLRRTELGDHVYRFEEIRPGESREKAHPHFLCTVCGTISCVGNVTLTDGSLRESNKVGEIVEILLRGRCNDCKS